jgi:hypothetical protein
MAEQLTSQQFAQRVRSKHPGAYDDISDDDLTQKVIAKYPEYRDMVAPAQTQSADKPWYERAAADIKQGVSDFGDTLLGAGKGALNTANTLANLTPSVYVGKKIVEKLNPEGAANADRMIEQAATPQTTRQKVGYTGEQIAEFFVPGGAVGKGKKLLDASLKSKAAILAGKAALEGASAAGVTAVQTKGDPNAVATSAALGAGGQVAGEALSPLVKPLKSWAKSQYAKVLAPTKEANKYVTQETVPELIKRGEWFGTQGRFENRAISEVEKLGNQIDNAVTNVPASVKPSRVDILDDLEKAKRAYIVNGVRVNESAIGKIDELKTVVRQLGPGVSYQSLNQVRRIWDKAVAQGGGYAGKTMAEGSAVAAMEEGANAIRRELARQSPDIAKINKEFHFWKGIDKVLTDTAKRKTGQFGGLVETGLMSTGGLGGFLHGGGLEAVLGVAGMKALYQTVTSTAWRTASPIVKDRLANAIANGRAKDVAAIVAKIGAGGNSALRSQQPRWQNQAIRQPVETE